MIGSLPTRAREAAVGCIKRGVVEIGIARFGEMPMNGFSWRCALREGGVWSDILDLKSGRTDLLYCTREGKSATAHWCESGVTCGAKCDGTEDCVCVCARCA